MPWAIDTPARRALMSCRVRMWGAVGLRGAPRSAARTTDLSQMFTGLYRHSLDQKNRVTVPNKFLQAIPDGAEKAKFYVTLGLDTCLFLYTISQFDEVAAQVRKTALSTPAARNFSRLFFAHAN